ncbi:hypothetical protein MMC30_000328 [Trapelia coarctata]|nr:hypothetical protein [Trapelia coarctata]
MIYLSDGTIVALLSFTSLSRAFPYGRGLDTREMFPGSYHDLKLRSPEGYPIAGNTKYPHLYQDQVYQRNYALHAQESGIGHHTHKDEERSERVQVALLERGRPAPRPAPRLAPRPAARPATRPAITPAITPAIQPSRKAAVPAKRLGASTGPATQGGSPPRSGIPSGHGTGNAIKPSQTGQAYTKQQLDKASPKKLGGKAIPPKQPVKPRPKSIYHNPSASKSDRSGGSHAPKANPSPNLRAIKKGNRTPVAAKPGPAG